MAKPGRPPAIPMTERPEFKAAVAETSAMVVQALLAKGIAPQAGDGPATGDEVETRSLFREMAMSMAEIADQGTNRKRVAPEILAKRAAAGDRMFELLSEVSDKLKLAKDEGDQATIEAWTPEYRVISKIAFNERIVEPFRMVNNQPVPQEIYWPGPPSDALVPLNAIAKKIFAEYKDWLGTTVGLGKTKWAPDTRPVWMTAGGMVVKGEAPAKRFVAPPQDFQDELGIKGQNDPRAAFINVTGTVAAPARQNTVQGANG